MGAFFFLLFEDNNVNHTSTNTIKQCELTTNNTRSAINECNYIIDGVMEVPMEKNPNENALLISTTTDIMKSCIVQYLRIDEFLFGPLLLCKQLYSDLNPFTECNHQFIHQILYNTFYNRISYYPLSGYNKAMIEYYEAAILINSTFYGHKYPVEIAIKSLANPYEESVIDLCQNYMFFSLFAGHGYWRDVLVLLHKANKFFFSFLHKWKFGKYCRVNMIELFVYLSFSVLNGIAIVIGFMLDLLFEKYSKFHDSQLFWFQLLSILQEFLLKSLRCKHIKSAEWIIKQIELDLTNACTKYVELTNNDSYKTEMNETFLTNSKRTQRWNACESNSSILS